MIAVAVAGYVLVALIFIATSSNDKTDAPGGGIVAIWIRSFLWPLILGALLLICVALAPIFVVDAIRGDL